MHNTFAGNRFITRFHYIINNQPGSTHHQGAFSSTQKFIKFTTCASRLAKQPQTATKVAQQPASLSLSIPTIFRRSSSQAESLYGAANSYQTVPNSPYPASTFFYSCFLLIQKGSGRSRFAMLTLPPSVPFSLRIRSLRSLILVAPHRQ